LVGVDLLTRYAIAHPLKTKTSLAVAKVVKREILNNPILGIPEVILTDHSGFQK